MFSNGEDEAKLLSLRRTLEASVAAGGDNSDEDIERDVEEVLAEVERRGV